MLTVEHPAWTGRHGTASTASCQATLARLAGLARPATGKPHLVAARITSLVHRPLNTGGWVGPGAVAGGTLVGRGAAPAPAAREGHGSLSISPGTLHSQAMAALLAQEHAYVSLPSPRPAP